MVRSLNVTVAALQPSTAVALPVLLVLVFAGHSKVKFGGITNEGAVESRTMIVWMPLVLFPQESMAVQVRAMTFVPAQLVVTTSLKLNETELQVSWATATPVLLVVGDVGHSSVTFGGKVRLGF